MKTMPCFRNCASLLIGAAFAASVAADQPSDREETLESDIVQMSEARSRPPAANRFRTPARRAAASMRANRPAPDSATSALAVPALAGPSFAGIDNASGEEGVPPDTHGAAGFEHYVEIVNDRVNVYALRDENGEALETPKLAQSMDNRAFFGVPKASDSAIYDGRVLFDAHENRWVLVSVDARNPERAQFVLAVSKTSDPAGAYFLYYYFAPLSAVNFANSWDFPQLGMNRDALFVTGEMFRGNVYRTTVLVAIPKAAAYRGEKLTAKRFKGLVGVLTPPVVLDDNPEAFFLAAFNGVALHLYQGENLGDSASASLKLKAKIKVPAYRAPPAAAQPGTRVRLDASDARFVNASSQHGNSLWNIHAIDVGGHAAAKFYEIDTAQAAIAQSGFFRQSDTSDDFNASLAVNPDGEVFVAWTSVDARQGVFPQIRYSGFAGGRFDNDPAVVQGQVLASSSVSYVDDGANPQRWGDYSAVSLDPASYRLPDGTCEAWRRAWIVNEIVDDPSYWGSRIARIGFC
jgi:hypothetical protein